MLLERVRHRYLEFRQRFDQTMADFKEYCVTLELDSAYADVGDTGVACNCCPSCLVCCSVTGRVCRAYHPFTFWGPLFLLI